MTITWPSILEARRWNANPRNFARSGGKTLTGRERRVFSDSGFWIVSVEEIRIHEREETQAYRALLARLRQGEDVLLPLREVYKPRGARAAASVTLTADAALRATVLGLTVTGIDVAAGSYLTIAGRLHLVTEIVSGPSDPPFVNQVATDAPWSDEIPWSDAVSNSAAMTVAIIPPLRAAAVAGTLVAFDDLFVRCVLQDLAEGDLSLDLGRLGAPSLTFIETI